MSIAVLNCGRVSFRTFSWSRHEYFSSLERVLVDVGPHDGIGHGTVPEVNERLDLGLWLPPVFRLWRRALMRQSRQLKLLPGEVEILCRHLERTGALVMVRGRAMPNAFMICDGKPPTWILYGLTSSPTAGVSGSAMTADLVAAVLDLLHAGTSCNSTIPCEGLAHGSQHSSQTEENVSKRGGRSRTEELSTVFLVILIVQAKTYT